MDVKKRTIRILHMRNIANNAYQNAKILYEHGYDNVVLCNDYYHIMACPEWDEASFEGQIINADYPQWHRIKMNGYKRPEWFVSGPLDTCIRYIKARCNNRKWKMLFWGRVNDICRFYISDINAGGVRKCVLQSISFWVLFFYNGVRWFEKRIKKDMNYSDVDETTLLEARSKTEEDFKTLFPDRLCHFGKDLDDYIILAHKLRQILSLFDVVIAYGTDPVFLYLSGVNNYIAYEHGTIRDIPYEDSDLGRLTLLSYAKAKAIICTNTDCYDSAKYITKNTNAPIICGLHGIDIDKLIHKIARVKTDNVIGKYTATITYPLFFCPSRHSWDSSRNTFIKGEERFIEAAAKLAEEGYEFTVMMVEWGNETDRCKYMIELHGDLSKHIVWLKPVSKNDLYYLYSISDAVIDQFALRAYGAIAFETLASGRPVLISAGAGDNIEKLFFGDVVPHFACNTAEGVFEALVEVINKSDKYLYYSSVGKEWIKEHHSKDKIYMALSTAISYVC